MATEAKRQARRRWKKAHPEALKAEKKRHRERHKEEIREYSRNWQREHTIKTRLLGANRLAKEREIHVEGKRLYPEDCRCELCGIKQVRGLNYHHWDDNDFSKGIWLCQACHNKQHKKTFM